MINNIYFIADLHVGPYSNRTLSCRGFKADWVRHLNLVRDSINAKVLRSDLLYILGDLGFKDATRDLEDFLKSLRCQKKVAIGNHDSKRQLQKLKEKGIIQDVKENYIFKYAGYDFDLSHFPKREWNQFYRNGFHLYGHTHGKLPQYYRSMDVGIDNIGYTPIAINEVIDILGKYNNTDERGNSHSFGKRYYKGHYDY